MQLSRRQNVNTEMVQAQRAAGAAYERRARNPVFESSTERSREQRPKPQCHKKGFRGLNLKTLTNEFALFCTLTIRLIHVYYNCYVSGLKQMLTQFFQLVMREHKVRKTSDVRKSTCFVTFLESFLSSGGKHYRQLNFLWTITVVHKFEELEKMLTKHELSSSLPESAQRQQVGNVILVYKLYFNQHGQKNTTCCFQRIFYRSAPSVVLRQIVCPDKGMHLYFQYAGSISDNTRQNRCRNIWFCQGLQFFSKITKKKS